MKGIDTNVLLRALLQDTPIETPMAEAILGGDETIYVSTIVLCELVWVLARTYRRRRTDIAKAIRRLIAANQIVVDRDQVHWGLRFLDQGGDFADGAIAYDARRSGADEMLTFDRDFARLGAPDVILIR